MLVSHKLGTHGEPYADTPIHFIAINLFGGYTEGNTEGKTEEKFLLAIEGTQTGSVLVLSSLGDLTKRYWCSFDPDAEEYKFYSSFDGKNVTMIKPFVRIVHTPPDVLLPLLDGTPFHHALRAEVVSFLPPFLIQKKDSVFAKHIVGFSQGFQDRMMMHYSIAYERFINWINNGQDTRIRGAFLTQAKVRSFGIRGESDASNDRSPDGGADKGAEQLEKKGNKGKRWQKRKKPDRMKQHSRGSANLSLSLAALFPFVPPNLLRLFVGLSDYEFMQLYQLLAASNGTAMSSFPPLIADKLRSLDVHERRILDSWLSGSTKMPGVSATDTAKPVGPSDGTGV